MYETGIKRLQLRFIKFMAEMGQGFLPKPTLMNKSLIYPNNQQVQNMYI